MSTPQVYAWALANFINAELWGRETTMPWGVIFPYSSNLRILHKRFMRASSDTALRHFEGLVLFILLFVLGGRAFADR